MSVPRPAVFVDRDGTVIEDRDYLADPAGVRLLPGAARAIARLNQAGIPVILVTNQSGIGRGYFTEDDYSSVHDRMTALLRAEGAELTAAFHCPHAPDRDPPCVCRKPRAGLFERAAAEFDLDLRRSFFVGDRLRDVLPGTSMGGSGFVIGGGDASELSEIPSEISVVASLSEAVDRVIAALPAN